MSTLRWTDARRRGLLAFDNREHVAYEYKCTAESYGAPGLILRRVSAWMRANKLAERMNPGDCRHVLTDAGVAELERIWGSQ